MRALSAMSVVAAAAPLELPVWSALPFVLILGGIAVLPLLAGRWWHSNRNKGIVSAGFALPVVLYLLARNGPTAGESLHRLLHEMGEYASFIILLSALYTISGGIWISGDLKATPGRNAAILAGGALLANLIGTTGASMILIRPYLRINAHRKRKIHLPIFFIFTVGNTGGLLTALGDTPLFLGFLKGVDFFWTLTLWREWLGVNLAVLAIFTFWDRRALRGEPAINSPPVREPLKLRGATVNAPLLAGVIAAVLLQSPAVGKPLGALFGAGDWTFHKPVGEAAMVVLTLLSLKLTPGGLRKANDFSWGPIAEVAILFAGIFATMVPALALLETRGGNLGLQTPRQYFWLTGLLSSCLDNAPTYVTFGALASSGHDMNWLMANRPDILGAISCGAVFLGALTYIGNGPNFMVKAIAEHSGYPMPGFAAYSGYAVGVLVPIFLVLSVIIH